MGRTAPAAGALLGVALGVAVCAGPGAFLDPGPVAPPVPLGLDAYVPIPPDNPLTLEGIELGRRLFFDPRLSADGRVSCASCHRPEHAFADTFPVSLGVHGRVGRRNAPSLVNVAYARFLFWDGREESLEEQVLRPVQDPLEMDLSLEELEARLRADRSYRRDFGRTYPDGATAVNAGRALASFLRTLNSGDAPVDRYRMRGDRDALTPAQLAGLQLFTGRANCSACHLGPNFTDDGFHNTGVAVRSADPGRYEVTGREEDRGTFRTPRLREVARTAPYMHDGSLATLEEVVEFYNGGGGAHPNRSPDVRPLGLTTEELRLLVAFLESL